MIEVMGSARHESDVLLRQLDGNLAGLRTRREPIDVMLAERVTEALRRLVTETSRASAADRARVRAAVHYFVLRRDGRRGYRPLTEDARVVNDILATLDRQDLQVSLTSTPV